MTRFSKPVDTVAEGVDAIRVRLGATFTIRNNRLFLQPASAYRLLTNDERAFLRDNRAAIKGLVVDGLPAPAPAAAPTEGTVAAVTRPPVHPSILAIINGNTPEEIERRSEKATAVMMAHFQSRNY